MPSRSVYESTIALPTSASARDGSWLELRSSSAEAPCSLAFGMRPDGTVEFTASGRVVGACPSPLGEELSHKLRGRETQGLTSGELLARQDAENCPCLSRTLGLSPSRSVRLRSLENAPGLPLTILSRKLTVLSGDEKAVALMNVKA